MRGKPVIKYNPDADALVITLSNEAPDYGEEVSPNIILHYSSSGRLVEIEILDASEFLSNVLRETLKTMHLKLTLRTIGEGKVST